MPRLGVDPSHDPPPTTDTSETEYSICAIRLLPDLLYGPVETGSVPSGPTVPVTVVVSHDEVPLPLIRRLRTVIVTVAPGIGWSF